MFTQLAFVCAHFSKAVAADGAAVQLAALPPEVMHQLLSSETLQASSEVEIAQVYFQQPAIQLLTSSHGMLWTGEHKYITDSRSLSASGKSLRRSKTSGLQVAVSWLEARWPCSAADVDRMLSTVRLPPGQLRSEV